MKHDMDFLKDAAKVVADAVAEQQAAELHAKRSAAAKKGWETRRQMYGPSGQDCDCTAHRSRFLSHGYVGHFNRMHP